jgi:hypothetical protein
MAVSRPMPLEAPVISAVFRVESLISISQHVSRHVFRRGVGHPIATTSLRKVSTEDGRDIRETARR